MAVRKILFFILASLAAIFCVYFSLNQLDLAIFLGLTTAFAFLSWQKPRISFYLILFLPVLGEFSRFSILGHSLVASDLFTPLFVLIASLNGKLRLNRTPELKKINRLILIFLGIASFSLLLSTLSLPISDVLAGSLYLIRLIGYLALFPIATNLFIEKADQIKLLKVIALSAFLIVLGGFAQLILLPDLKELAKTQGYDPHINRLVGSWLDPNFIGGFFAFIISIYTGIALYNKSRKTNFFIIIFVSILGIALFLTYSRSAYVAIALGILILGLFRSRKLVISLFLIALIGLSLSSRAQERVSELVTSINSVLFSTSENPDPTARLRLQNWDQTTQLIQQKPFFGQGYNTLNYVKIQAGFIKDDSTHSASGSDSSLLTIAATTGLIGLSLFLLIYFQFIKQAFLKWRTSSTNYQKGLGLGILAGLMALLLHSNFVNSLLFPQIMIFLWPLLALLY